MSYYQRQPPEDGFLIALSLCVVLFIWATFLTVHFIR